MTYSEPRLQRFLEAGFAAPQKFEHRALHELEVSREDAALNVLSTMNLLLFERLHYVDIPLPLLVVLAQSGLSRHAILLALYLYGEQSLQARWAGNRLPKTFQPVKATRAELAQLLGMSKKQFDTGKQELILHDMLFVEPYRDGRQVEANLYHFYLPDELVERIHKHAPRIARPAAKLVTSETAPADSPATVEVTHAQAAAAEPAVAPAVAEQVLRYGPANPANPFAATLERIRSNRQQKRPVEKNLADAKSGDTPLPENGEAKKQTTAIGFDMNLHKVPQPLSVDRATAAPALPAEVVAMKDCLPCRNARGDMGYEVNGMFIKAEKPLFRKHAAQLMVEIVEKGWTVWQGMQLLTIMEDSYRQADHSTIKPLVLGRGLIKMADRGKLNIPRGFGNRHAMSVDITRGNRSHNVRGN